MSQESLQSNEAGTLAYLPCRREKIMSFCASAVPPSYNVRLLTLILSFPARILSAPFGNALALTGPTELTRPCLASIRQPHLSPTLSCSTAQRVSDGQPNIGRAEVGGQLDMASVLPCPALLSPRPSAMSCAMSAIGAWRPDPEMDFQAKRVLESFLSHSHKTRSLQNTLILLGP